MTVTIHNPLTSCQPDRQLLLESLVSTADNQLTDTDGVVPDLADLLP